MNEHDDAYVDAMLMVNMQANTRSVTVCQTDKDGSIITAKWYTKEILLFLPLVPDNMLHWHCYSTITAKWYSILELILHLSPPDGTLDHHKCFH